MVTGKPYQCNFGIQTSIKITYDDVNRRMLVNPREFIDSAIDINRNSITIPNHGFKKW